MGELKLPQLPDRRPVKLSISLTPNLHQLLIDYAAAYETAYGTRESVAELIPFMLVRFLESDRAFAGARKIGR